MLCGGIGVVGCEVAVERCAIVCSQPGAKFERRLDVTRVLGELVGSLHKYKTPAAAVACWLGMCV